ncbi:MAG: hypothetical protein NVSMB51_16130 [Solirubrobacteraceae bacterium]
MSVALTAAVALSVALASVLLTTPVVIRLANHLQFFDRPAAAAYKAHSHPTPYLGGAAVLAGFLLGLMALAGDWDRTGPLAAGGAILWVVGTVDDRRTVPPGVRVAIEIAVAAMLWLSDISWNLGLGGGVDLVATICWVVGIVNAVNLFDNMDGAASSVAMAIGCGVIALAAVENDTWLLVAAAALVGSCLGFLRDNLASPARIFLGDGGSMPLGFIIAVLTMVGASEAVAAVPSLIAGLLLVGVPAFDTFLVIVSRRKRGISILTGGKDHLTHRTKRWLRTARATALTLGGVQAVISVVAVLATQGSSTLLIGGATVYLMVAGAAFAAVEGRRVWEPPVLAPADVLSPSPNGLLPRRRRAGLSPIAAIVFLGGAALGSSAFSGGFYAQSLWVPIGGGLIALVVVTALAAPVRLSTPAWLMLAGLLGLAAWSLLSTQWSDSVERAFVEGNRMIVLCAILACGLLLVRGREAGGWLLAGLGAGIAAVAVSVIVNLLGSNPNAQFLVGRLNLPLGYVNAEGTVFLMGFWIFAALAERRRPLAAAAGAGGAALMACLALLSQSRGVAVALIGSAILVLALVPGRLRRYALLAFVAAGTALAGGRLVDVYHVGQLRAIPASVGHSAAVAAIACAIGVALAWGVTVALLERSLQSSPGLGARLQRFGTVALSLVALVVTVGAVVFAGSIDRRVSAQWNAFVRLAEPSTVSSQAPSSRLLSGAGNRSDYWRVAWHAWQAHPLRGYGAGNYDVPYFKARRTTEAIRQPHSFELQVLSELGLVGFGFMVLLVAGVAAGAWRLRRAARSSRSERTLMVGAVGVTSAWLIHSSVDWIHLIPGAAGAALVAAAILCRPADESLAAAPNTARPSALRVGTAAALGGLVLVLAALSLTRQGIADALDSRARSELAAHPANALRDANSSLRLDPYKVEGYYTKAAALARFGQARPAEATLLAASREEPNNFVTWVLLGDVAVRTGHLNAAKSYYARASALDPLEPGLALLASNPLNGSSAH